MPVLKKADLAEKGILDQYIKDVKEATAETKKLQDQVRNVNKTGSGAEAKERITIAKKLTTSTKKLKDALTAEEKVKQDILRANAKLSQSRTKSAKDLALVRQKTLQQNKALRDQAKAQLKVKKGLGSLTKQMIGGAGIIGGIRALIGILKTSFKIFVDFEKAGSRLAAILGKTKDEITNLTNQAKELGSVTAFTASQILGLQTELAKLGFDTSDIESMTEGVLDLAAATGTDLASAAELTGATLRIFNLNANEATRVADVLAVSTTKSSLSMEKLATALPTVGKTAQIAGVSLERTVALLGTLTDRGIDASTASTALRNVFLKLSKKGLTWDEALQQINESTDKNKTSMDIFGVRAAAVGVILSQTGESTDELNDSLVNLDSSAKQIGETMLDNVAGDITKASSAWEGFVLSIADGEGIISKAVRGMVQSFTNLLIGLTNFNEGTFLNKTKTLANGILALFGVSQEYRFEIESLEETKKKVNKEFSKATSIFDMQKEALNKLIESENANVDALEKTKEKTKELTSAQKKLLAEQKALNDELRKRKEILSDLPDEITTKTTTEQAGRAVLDIIDKDPVSEQKIQNDALLGLNQMFLNAKSTQEAQQAEVDLEAKLERIEEEEEAIKEIKEAALNGLAEIATNIFNSRADEEIARIQSDADTQIKILQDQLDKGVISEDEFTKKKEAIEKEARKKSAEAEKKKAIWEAVIATALAIVKAAPSILKMALAAVIGGIQIAVIAAKPIPEFAEGEVNIDAPSHAKGGKDINIEGNESIIKASATRNTEGLLNLINEGLVTDKSYFSNQGSSVLDMNELLSKFEENIIQTKRTNQYLSNLYSSHVINGFLYKTNTFGKTTTQKLNDTI